MFANLGMERNRRVKKQIYKQRGKEEQINKTHRQKNDQGSRQTNKEGGNKINKIQIKRQRNRQIYIYTHIHRGRKKETEEDKKQIDRQKGKYRK